MKRCIINVAVGSWYPRGQDRLIASLKQFGFDGEILTWRDRFPDGCPPHAQVPYAFKAYAFEHAVELGFETVLWLDCSCWAVKSLSEMFAHIEHEGHLFSWEGFAAGEWLKDAALAPLRVTRDQAMGIPLLGGMIMGVCVKSPRSRAWLADFIRICKDGTTLPGSHRNINNCVSSDPRCQGHTHDQSVASVLAFRHGMGLTYPPAWRDWARPDVDPATVILAQGM